MSFPMFVVVQSQRKKGKDDTSSSSPQSNNDSIDRLCGVTTGGLRTEGRTGTPAEKYRGLEITENSQKKGSQRREEDKAEGA